MRKRPGMYIGSTGARGLHHLIYEVVDNSVDEALAGEADARRDRHPPRQQRHRHRQRPRHPRRACMEKEGRPAAEVVLTVLHAGGKFGDGGGYKVSGGLHGVGVSVVNALSERLALTIWREGHEWTQPYERGTPMSELEKGAEVGPARAPSITFLPDLEIFETIDYDRTVLEQRFREMAFLTQRPQDRLPRRARRALRDELPVRGRHRRLRQVPALAGHPRAAPSEDRLRRGDQRRRARSRWRSSGTTPTRRRSSRSPTTSTRTRAARTCRASARRSPARSTTTRARRVSSRRRTQNLQGEDVREGLTAIISVKIREPQFEGQTKTKLGNPPDRGLRAGRRQQGPGGVPRGEPHRRPHGHPQVGRGRPRPRRRAQGARPDPTQVGARELHPPGQARRLLGARPRAGGDLHRRGRLRRRLGEGRAATGTPRRSCRCAARSSTSRRTASTRSSPTRRSRR